MAEACGVAAGLLTLALLYRLFFRDSEELFEAIGYWFKPDMWSLFKGEFAADWFAEAKLGLWIGISSIVGFGVYAVVADMISTQ